MITHDGDSSRTTDALADFAAIECSLILACAAGEPLGFTQLDVTIEGWAIENRVYAEDPYRGFLPSTGRLVRYRPPEEGAGVRVDDGVVEGSEIAMFYDPMVAKLVTHAPTREAAIDAQIGALDRFEIAGIGHNVDFLSALMQHPRFRDGAITTGFIAEEYPDGFHGAPASPKLRRTLAALAAAIDHARSAVEGTISGQLDGRPPIAAERTVLLDGETFEASVEATDGGMRVRFGGDTLPLEIVGRWRPGQPLFAACVDGVSIALRVARRPAGWRLTTRGATHDVRVHPPRIAALARHMIASERRASTATPSPSTMR